MDYRGIEKNNIWNFFCKLVLNRKASTIQKILEDNVMVGTKCVTDGYPSYVGAVRKFGSQHIVVNHTDGFKNSDGYTTNKIENLWSHMKNLYRSRNGLFSSKIPVFWKNLFLGRGTLLTKQKLHLKEYFL
jgi:hypothetical protein